MQTPGDKTPRTPARLRPADLRRRASTWVRLALALLFLWSFAQTADAQPSPMLHEFVPPSAVDDVTMPGTVPGGFPSAIDTPSGPVSAPDVRTSKDPSRTYQPSNARFDTYQPDRQTNRPHVERYDDPFTPTLTPFKRMHAFDAIRDDYTLYVREPLRRQLRSTGQAASSEETFFADMSLQLQAGEDVPIPSVGPGARLLKWFAVPDVDLTFSVDGAENWTVRGKTNGVVRLVMQIAIARDVFGSSFAATDWSSLPPAGTPPSSHRVAFERVAAAVGLSHDITPAEAVARMVAYFRSFAPSDESPNQNGDVYLDLALSKKGVCRHRAFAFMVTAVYLGIPARFVHNEAHAWVEVHDGTMWHRVDLGGASLDLDEEDPHLDRPEHVPPPDPYEWPTGRDSGADLARRHYEDLRAQLGTNTPGQPDPNGTTPGQGPGPGPGDPSGLPRSTITLEVIDRDVFRGLPLHLKGKITADGKACARVRVDLVLQATQSAAVVLGSLSTDERGVYDGAVVVPTDVPTGDHELVLRTAGNATCGPGEGR